MPTSKHAQQLTTARHITIFYSYLFVVWGFYRLLLFQLPAPFEVLLIKPLIWLIPTFYLLRKEKQSLSSLGLSLENLFPTLYFTLILGVAFSFIGVIINFLKYDGLDFSAVIGPDAFLITFILSFATAFSEELAFRGYIYTRLQSILDSELLANLISSIGWVAIHLPIAALDWRLSPPQLGSYLILIMLYSLGTTFVFARTKNIFSAIFLHVLWQWPIILFR